MSGPVYTNQHSAQSAALRMALDASPSRKVEFVPFSGGAHRERAVRPVEGGPAFAVRMLVADWLVEQLDAEQLAERCRVGRRRAIDDLLDRAKKARARAEELLGSKFADRHNKEARRLVLEAEALLSDNEPITSAERDSRVAS